MKEFIERLLPIERDLFISLNGSDSVFLDNIFWTITGRYIWIPMLLFLAVMFFYKRPLKEAILTVVALTLVFVACDQVSSSIFKEIFQRLRPGNHPDFKDVVDTVKGYRGGGFSFISGHATNSFGAAYFLTRLYANRWVSIPVLTWAALNSYSRIYLGVHFLSDIIGGTIVGLILGLIIFTLFALIRRRYLYHKTGEKQEYAFNKGRARTVGIVIASYLLFIIIFSPLLSTIPH